MTGLLAETAPLLPHTPMTVFLSLSHAKGTVESLLESVWLCGVTWCSAQAARTSTIPAHGSQLYLDI